MRAWGALVAVLVLALAAGAFWRSRPAPGPGAPPVGEDPVPLPPPVAAPVPVPTPPAVRKHREDPRIDLWYRAVLRKDAPGVLEAQAALLAAEDETRGPLEAVASGDPEARMRAFSTAVLGRMKRPPPASFFASRLSDPEPGPRIAALAALEKVGTRADLPAVEACAAPEEVRRAAEKTASVLRSK